LVFFFEFEHVGTAAKEQPQFFHLHGLAQEVVSTCTHCLDGILLFALSGNDDYLGRVINRE
jgi:hypothetical protein